MALRDSLACPACHTALTSAEHSLKCTSCTASYPVREGVPYFVESNPVHVVHSHHRSRSLWRKAGKLVKPPHHSMYFDSWTPSYGEDRSLKEFLQAHPTLPVLNIGSLSIDLSDLHPDITNLDISPYPSIDIVADAHALPFADASVDIILCKNVLEHIRDPSTALREIERVLKPGGYLYMKIPFLQPFHAVPDDYQRYTEHGMHELMQQYQQCAFGIAVGPGSMLSWMLREFLAVLTSFGSMRLYQAGIILWGWLTFWIQYLDIFFRRNPLSNRVTSAFYGIYRKKLS